jgi:hypothetical protein
VKDAHIEFLLEERSMMLALRTILPRILPEGYALDRNVFLRPHNGKSDLQKSIPAKARVFSSFHRPARIVIIHDQDSNDCQKLKADLLNLVKQNGNCPALIRIACRELEAWYLGDMDAVQKVYPKFKAAQHRSSAKFRNPDKVNASAELQRLIEGFQKGFAAREIPQYLEIEKNNSPSFSAFVTGLRQFLN